MALSIVKPKSDSKNWGDTYNKALDDIVFEVNKKLNNTNDVAMMSDLNLWKSLLQTEVNQLRGDLINIDKRLLEINSYIQHIEPDFNLTSITLVVTPLSTGFSFKVATKPAFAMLNWDIQISTNIDFTEYTGLRPITRINVIEDDETGLTVSSGGIIFEDNFTGSSIRIDVAEFPLRIRQGARLWVRVRANNARGESSEWCTARFTFRTVNSDLYNSVDLNSQNAIMLLNSINPVLTKSLLALANQTPESVLQVLRGNADSFNNEGGADDGCPIGGGPHPNRED